MRRAVLIHWKPEEAEHRLALVPAAGWSVCCFTPHGGNLKSLRQQPPEVFIIDLSRLPSQGCAVGQALRQWKATRFVPLVFAGGLPDKVEKVRAILPDAVYTSWDAIATALTEAVRSAPDEPVVCPPLSVYGNRTLEEKLGIRPGSTLAVVSAPQAFLRKLTVPTGVRIVERVARADRVLLFVRSMEELTSLWCAVSKAVGGRGRIWVIYPKRTSGIDTDINQTTVRRFAKHAGWVDFKICAVDETWTAMLFAPAKVTTG